MRPYLDNNIDIDIDIDLCSEAENVTNNFHGRIGEGGAVDPWVRLSLVHCHPDTIPLPLSLSLLSFFSASDCSFPYILKHSRLACILFLRSYNQWRTTSPTVLGR